MVPNLYPALGTAQGELVNQEATNSPGSGPAADAGAFASSGDPLLATKRAGEPDLFSTRPAAGSHEVLINSPDHVTAMAELDEEQFGAAIATWRERMRAHADASYLQLIVNEGEAPAPPSSTPTPSSTRCPSSPPPSPASASGSAPMANAPPAAGC